MKIFKGETDIYLEDTSIENLFINEYMIPAKGDYVKVYLFAKMHAENCGPLTNESLSKYLNLSLGEILNAWDYWESKKVVVKHYHSDHSAEYDIEFISLKKLMFRGEGSKKKLKSLSTLNAAVYSEKIIPLLSQLEKKTRRTLGGNELQEIKLWHEDWGMEEAVIVQAYEEASKKKKENEFSYILGIVRNWKEKGLLTKDLLETYLSEHDKRHNQYKRIFKAMGFRNRFPSEAEEEMMDIWFDQYGFQMETVLEACKTSANIPSPSIKYIHSVLKAWHEEGKINQTGHKKPVISDLLKEYEKTRRKNEAVLQKRFDEIYLESNRIKEIDQEVKELNPKLLKMLVSGQNKSATYHSMQTELDNLQKERIHILEYLGKDDAYLNPIYDCTICKDTGFLENGEKCICLIHKLK